MKKLIVGLGNPGRKYEHTRHNVGFRVIDALAKKNLKAILLKPDTFMNESGSAVQKLIKDYRLSIIDLLIVHDEIDLPFGKIRLSIGGAAGHKGAESVITAIGEGFARLRIGIENRTEYRIPPTDDYVLQKFSGDEEKQLAEKIIPEAVGTIENWLGK